MNTKTGTRNSQPEPRAIVFMAGTITPKDMAQSELGIPDEFIGRDAESVKAHFCCDNVEATIIVNLIETAVCHCLLRELSDRQFRRAVQEAREIFEEDREFFIQANAEARALFHKGKREEAAIKAALTYEV